MTQQVPLPLKLAFVLVLLSQTALPEQRRVASLGHSPESGQKLVVRGKGDLADRNLEAQVSLVTGYALINADSETDSNVLVGLSADVRIYRYFGVELDGLHGISLKKLGSTSYGVSSISSLGKLQYPISLGMTTLTPKIGAGYGFNWSQRVEVAEDESESDLNKDSTQLDGPVAMLGVDLALGPNWTLSADFSHSLSANGSTKVGDESVLTDTGFSDARFYRVRAGLSYQVFPHARIGAQYQRRELRYSFSNDSGSGFAPLETSTIQNLFVGLFAYEL